MLRVQETDESAIRSLHNGGISKRLSMLLPHNGCRPPKDVEFNNIFKYN
jgi:hypothetical protein